MKNWLPAFVLAWCCPQAEEPAEREGMKLKNEERDERGKKDIQDCYDSKEEKKWEITGWPFWLPFFPPFPFLLFSRLRCWRTESRSGPGVPIPEERVLRGRAPSLNERMRGMPGVLRRSSLGGRELPELVGGHEGAAAPRAGAVCGPKPAGLITAGVLWETAWLEDGPGGGTLPAGWPSNGWPELTGLDWPEGGGRGTAAPLSRVPRAGNP